MTTSIGEDEKRLLAESVQERLIGSKNSVLYSELIDKKIPTFLRNYLQNYVRKLVYTEEPVQFKNSRRFDFEHPKVQQLRTSLLQVFEEVAVLSREELVEAINKTVRLQFDLIIRPNATLLKIFYGNKSDQKKTDILPILEGLKDGRIFLEKLILKLKEFDQFHIVETDFKRLLKETETEVFRDQFLDAFLSEVKSFINFLSMTHGYNGREIKLGIVKLLLKERNQDHYQNAFSEYESELIDLDNLRKLLEKYIFENRGGTGESGRDDTVNRTTRSEEYLNNQEERTSVVKGQSHFKADSSQNLLDETVVTTTKKVNGKIIKNSDPSEWIIDRRKIEQQPEGPLEPMEKIIDEKSRKIIVKKIFDQDCDAYETFINRLNGIDNWKAAKEMIEIELHRRHIMPFSKEALRLGDLAFTRYFPEKHL